MTELELLDGAARMMAAQRTMLDVAARNVAAAQAATPGHPYERLVARFVAEAEQPDGDDDEGRGDDAGVTLARVPGDGDALTELLAVLEAQRAYEAGASVFDTGKRLAERTLDIERA